MTKNKIKKIDFLKEYEKVNPNREDHYDPNPYKDIIIELQAILESEIGISLELKSYNQIGENLILRNVTCAKNCLINLFDCNYYDAWWELVDILDYRKDDDYVSENELSILYLLVVAFNLAINQIEC